MDNLSLFLEDIPKEMCGANTFCCSQYFSNYSVGSYEGRDHLSIYLWKFQGDGAYTEMEEREFSGTTCFLL